MKKILFFITAFLLIVTVFAHEYVLLATKYRLKKGETLEMHLFVADGFNIEAERPFQKTPTKSFALITKDQVVDLSTIAEGTLPIIKRTVDFEGGGLVHLERNYARISLATDKFMSYLKEDHMEYISPKVDRTKKEQKERYTRYIKSLVQSEARFTDTVYKTVVGHNLEIIFLNNPYQLKVNSLLKVRILFMGAPLKNKTITARNREGSSPSIAITSSTNAQGECAFTLQRKGEWFVHVTHMIECPDKTDSDWESYWASYSFEIDR